MAYQQLSQQLAEELTNANAIILALRSEAAASNDRFVKELRKAEELIVGLEYELAACSQNTIASHATEGKRKPCFHVVGNEAMRADPCKSGDSTLASTQPGVKPTAKPGIRPITKCVSKSHERFRYDLSSSEEDLPVLSKVKTEKLEKPRESLQGGISTLRISTTPFASRDNQNKSNYRVQKPPPKSKLATPTGKGFGAKKMAKGQLLTGPMHTKRCASKIRPSLAEITPFEFTLITAYTSDDKDNFNYFHSSDLPADNYIQDLWALIATLTDSWEAVAGAEWQWEFAKPSVRRRGRVCVASKLAKKQTLWRDGDDGFFACADCAGMGRPCFTWEEDAFWCLPLAEGDRRNPVAEGKEIRFWINERDEVRDDMVLK